MSFLLHEIWILIDSSTDDEMVQPMNYYLMINMANTNQYHRKVKCINQMQIVRHLWEKKNDSKNLGHGRDQFVSKNETMAINPAQKFSKFYEHHGTYPILIFINQISLAK